MLTPGPISLAVKCITVPELGGEAAYATHMLQVSGRKGNIMGPAACTPCLNSFTLSVIFTHTLPYYYVLCLLNNADCQNGCQSACAAGDLAPMAESQPCWCSVTAHICSWSIAQFFSIVSTSQQLILITSPYRLNFLFLLQFSVSYSRWFKSESVWEQNVLSNRPAAMFPWA